MAYISNGVYDTAMEQEMEEHMEKKVYITEEEKQNKLRGRKQYFAELAGIETR